MSVDTKPIFKLLPDARNTVVLHLTNESVYGYTAPDEGRYSVFAAWIARDKVAFRAVNFTSTPGNKEIITSPQDVTELKKEAAIVITSTLLSPEVRKKSIPPPANR